MIEQVKKYLEHKNYIAVLTFGNFIQEITEIYNSTLLIPLKKLYHNDYIQYLTDFGTLYGFKFSTENIAVFNKDYENNIPVVLILHKVKEASNSIYEFNEINYPEIEKAKLFLSINCGQYSHDFFKIICNDNKKFYKTEIQQFNEVYRLWLLDNEKEDFSRQLEKIILNQRFSVSLFQDANREINTVYKIARYFLVLESIVGSESESRKKIRSFFSVNNYSYYYSFSNPIEKLEIDSIEFSGIIRSKIFHGVNIKYIYFKKFFSSEVSFAFMLNNLENFAKFMRDLCETALIMKEKNFR